MTAGLPTIVLHLSLPPSANKLWISEPGRARRRSPEYRSWLWNAGWEARRQLVGVPTIVGTFNAVIQVPRSSRRDRDNWTKPLFDLAQLAGAIRNDSGLGSYTVEPAEREDVCLALWDMGGPEQRVPANLRLSAPPRRSRRVTPAQVERYRKAGVLL